MVMDKGPQQLDTARTIKLQALEVVAMVGHFLFMTLVAKCIKYTIIS